MDPEVISFDKQYRELWARVRQEQLGAVLSGLPPNDPVQFADGRVFIINGRAYNYLLLLDMGRSIVRTWACSDGNVIQEPVGPFGTTRFWTGQAGLVLHPPRPFDTPGFREGLKTPTSPETLPLVRFYMMQFVHRRGGERGGALKRATVAWPDLDRLIKALRILSTPAPTQQQQPSNFSELHQRREMIKINLRPWAVSSHLREGAMPSSSRFEQALREVRPGALSEATDQADDVDSRLETMSNLLIDSERQRSLSKSTSKHKGEASADRQAKHSGQTPHSDSHGFEGSQARRDPTSDLSSAFTGVSISTSPSLTSRATLASRVGLQLLKHLPPLSQIKFVPSPQTDYVRIQIRLGQQNGRLIHAAFRPTAEGTAAPSFFMLTCVVELVESSGIGGAWNKVDFGERQDILGAIPSNLTFPFSEATNLEEVKALCKWYFTLAADAGLHGFKDQLFLVNDTLVTQLKKACMRVRDSSSDRGSDYSSVDGSQAENLGSRFASVKLDYDFEDNRSTTGCSHSTDSFAEFQQHVSADSAEFCAEVHQHVSVSSALESIVSTNEQSPKKKHGSIRKHPAQRAPIVKKAPKARSHHRVALAPATSHRIQPRTWTPDVSDDAKRTTRLGRAREHPAHNMRMLQKYGDKVKKSRARVNRLQDEMSVTGGADEDTLRIHIRSSRDREEVVRALRLRSGNVVLRKEAREGKET
ncbi:hypothetical protein EK21DRAFT_90226 [Setomelanomma holmii]|uniref:Uncharacterized protein n=1 Tax=Setomelanomma holmii TaxID=210430 RepID=A0A9P4H8H9_9PLEO|nr:hypothetical protein EK21DRAFT_90226 [Setomelanomma holmii]